MAGYYPRSAAEMIDLAALSTWCNSDPLIAVRCFDGPRRVRQDTLLAIEEVNKPKQEAGGRASFQARNCADSMPRKISRNGVCRKMLGNRGRRSGVG